VNKTTIVKGAVVSIGDFNEIRDVNVQVNMVEAMADDELHSLAEQLASLRQALQSKAVSTDDFVELGQLAQAEKAAQAGDKTGVFDALKKVGRWSLDAARDLGVALLAEVIKKSAGIG
jgi:hypothetical protein